MEFEKTPDGVEQGTSTGEATSTAKVESTGQPEVIKQEDFRKWQSNADRRIAQAERLAQENAMRAQQFEQAFHQQQLQGLDANGKVAYENQLLQRQLQELQRQRDLDAYAMQRQRDLDDIVRKTGVPLDMIENANNVHEAWQIGYDYREKNGTGQRQVSRQEEILAKTDNTVDIGGGKAQGKVAVIQEKYDAARRLYNMKEQLEAMAEADAAGVTIKEW